MTAPCALYIGALKIFEIPWVRPWLLLPKFLMGFCSDRSMNVRTKFEVRSLTRSWDSKGTQKTGQSRYAYALFSPKFFMDSWMYRPNLQSVALPVPDIIAIAVLGGLRSNLQSWGRGSLKGSRIVPFERAFVISYNALHSNFPSIFTRFRDIAAYFVPEHTTFPHPCDSTSSSPKFRHVSVGVGGHLLTCLLA